MRLVATILLSCAISSPAAAHQSSRADQPGATAGALNKVVCKRFIRTGSLVDAYKVCKTRVDWDRERDNAQQFNRTFSCNLAIDPDACSK